MKKQVSAVMAGILAFSLAGYAGSAAQFSSVLADDETEALEEAATEAPGAASAVTSQQFTPGTYTATADGIGEVTVDVTVDENSIQDVTLHLDNETADIGQKAGDSLKEQILSAQSADINGVSGATVTSTAVKTALKKALDEASGHTSRPAEVKMKPGTYEAESYGFFAGISDKIRVTVDETSIVSIEWNPDEVSGDTPVMRKTVEKNLFPRIIDSQSVTVDGVTGATATSAAVKAAASDALQQALEAGGSDASALSAFQNKPAKTGTKEELTTDVLVIGLGGSGTYTALRAAEQGLDVLAIEKQGRYGGTTALTSEIGVINPPRIQEKYNQGNDYTDVDAMKEAWKEYVENDEKPEILDLYFEQSGPALDWLALDHDIEFDWDAKPGFTEADWYKIKFQWLPNHNPDDPDDNRFWNVNKTEIAENFDKLMADYEKAGGKYMLETTAENLIMEDGKVTGVKAVSNLDGTEYTIHARAVVIAEGGFLGNGELTEKYLSDEYYPLKGTWKVYGSKGNVGTMMEDAIENGAATYNIGMPPEVHLAGSDQFIPVSAGFEVHEIEGVISAAMGTPMVWSAADAPMYLGIAADSMAVGMDGRRFSSEEGISMLDPWKAGPNYYSIWSKDQLDKVKENGFHQNFDTVPPSAFLGFCGSIPEGEPLPELYDVLGKAEEMGFVWQADSIGELADKIGVPADNLKTEVDNYNKYAQTGTDEEFGKPAEDLTAFGDGPYYAIKMASYSYNTVAGLDINDKMQVLDTYGNPIEGLYAVGSDSAGVLFSEKKPYVTFGGINNGWALTSGYIAGVTVADFVNGTDNAADILNSEVLKAQ